MTDDKLTLEQVQQTYGQLADAKELLYDWYGTNTSLFKWINSIHGPNYDQFMYFATQLGNKYFILQYMALLGVAAVLSVLYRKIFRKGGVKQYMFMWISSFAVLAASFAIYVVLVSWMKDYFAYARPYVLLEGVVMLEDKLPADAYRSFPSGHVSFIALMVFSLWPVLSGNMRLLGVSLIALVAWSRVALGVHFPADTLWSVIIGFSIVFAARAVIHAVFKKILGIHVVDGD
jgi:signal peptidase II